MRPKPARSQAARRRRRTVVVWLAVPALATAALTACSSSDGPGGKGGDATVALEGVGNPGDAPFLKAPDSDVRGVSSAGGGGRTDATAPGAFGGTRQATRCDKAQLLKELAADPQKARAWSKARGIPEQDIERHVTGLTAVVLLHDTLVTNHNYVGGGVTRSYQSVLQAGMAVLVDAYGKPAVKCNCGNPLRQPDSGVDARKARYEGTRWEGFAAAVVTVVQPRPEAQGPMKRLPLADVQDRGKGFEREVGDDGKRDSRPVPLPAPSPATGGPSQPGGPSQGPSSPGSSSGAPSPDRSASGASSPDRSAPGVSSPDRSSSGSSSAGRSSSGASSPGGSSSGPSSAGGSSAGGPSPGGSSRRTAPPATRAPGTSTEAPSSRPAPTAAPSRRPSPKIPPPDGDSYSKSPSHGGSSADTGSSHPPPATGRHTPPPRTPADDSGPAARPSAHSPARESAPATHPSAHSPAYEVPHAPVPRTEHTPSEQHRSHPERGESTGGQPANPPRRTGT
ncbi:DUF6777 domain-containing protein [Streptomyces caatingaensis]|uniref:DUF6777 domain-containing protein n=1 Tax=Streptomyces caatingaensis TaxID=1678637 RepID=A0A0K9XFZ4_9ACTN|nr:DUF6777 domain-containing protein [Streptomyces caatingaensis]KNB52329.1 hypothetical protein AC230_12380 [Streptomyces caatingaensis]